MKALIFANGEFDAPAGLDDLITSADLLIAADGGTRHILQLGLQPDVVIGDLDSLDAVERKKLRAAGEKVLAFPVEKDESDLELAIRHAQEAGAEKVTVLAGLGRRWDHSLANVLLAEQACFSELQIDFIQGEQRLFVIRGAAEIDAEVGERISLIPLQGDAKGVITQGLAYPLAGETLEYGSSRGISNAAVLENVRVSLESGSLLCVISPSEFE